MILNKLWERYFLRETVKFILFFIVCFYGLYVLIDYASHSRGTLHKTHGWFQWRGIGFYYLCEFCNKLNVLVPFAVLIATVRMLCKMMQNNELVALMASGIALKTLLRPFLMIACAAMLLIYLNTELIMPTVLKELRLLDDEAHSKKPKKQDFIQVKHIQLEDGSTLLFQNYDSANQRFFDAYWIRSINEIYRIKYLYPYADIPTGLYVDHLTRNTDGYLITKETLPKHEFPQIHFNKRSLLETITPEEELALSDLWNKLPHHQSAATEKDAALLSAFYLKMVLPWLCILAVIGPAPYCVRFSRQQPTFFIYAFSIFGLVAAYLILDASAVLGERQVVHPAIAIGLPFLLLFVPSMYKYARVA